MKMTSQNKAVVLGASGFLGEYLVNAFSEAGFEVKCASERNSPIKVDVKDHVGLEVLFKSIRPKIIVNCVALVDVDYCEKNLDVALLVNTLSNIVIRKYLSHDQTCKAVFISTDHLYNSVGFSPEESAKYTNVYAGTKLLAEKALENSNTMIFRCNFFGDRINGKTHGLMGWVKNNAVNAKKINGWNNVYFNPLRVDLLARYILHSISLFKPGVYNIGSNNRISKHRFCSLVYEKYGASPDLVKSTELRHEKDLTPRPFDMTMNVSKIEELLKIKMPSVEEQMLNNY